MLGFYHVVPPETELGISEIELWVFILDLNHQIVVLLCLVPFLKHFVLLAEIEKLLTNLHLGEVLNISLGELRLKLSAKHALFIEFFHFVCYQVQNILSHVFHQENI